MHWGGALVIIAAAVVPLLRTGVMALSVKTTKKPSASWLKRFWHVSHDAY